MKENFGGPTLFDIERLIKNGRSENLEFFGSLHDVESVLQTVCAFLNNKNKSGGAILIGVTVDGQMAGVKDQPEPEQYRVILEKYRPKIVSTWWTIPFEDKLLIYIDVPGAPYNEAEHYKYNGCSYRRIGTNTVLLN